ncbi:sulfur carrier protein ThiS [Sulfuriroseicoccus oceanibius]|uniref:Sulfur carrier protein ThiS n=1 Tax=Sulfuriroseicoccus oceanibius TaxID=2707525 RepID=A0A6B3L7T3_9BACT|nr:sulfur carrier protein ThiS [Sulfuriroseicoccus oceanibius]QQL43796.1 sulfur carrier protein ThiS [Sulfuriroseicoccus oceanibius]
MTLTINGNDTTFGDNAPATVTDLLKHLGLEGKPVLVEHNGTALFPREFPTTNLTTSDRLELIQVAAGG